MPGSWTWSIVPLLSAISVSQALHHMRQSALHTVNRRDSDLPLRVTNRCEEDIYPAIFTQAGVGPDTSGFHLAPGATRNLTVSADWQGRVWGRTNCTVDQDGNPRSGQGGRTCTTGDCGTFPECQGVVGHSLLDESRYSDTQSRLAPPQHWPNSPCPPRHVRRSTMCRWSTDTISPWVS